MRTITVNLGALLLFALSYVATWQHRPWLALTLFVASLPIYRLGNRTNGEDTVR